MQAESTAASAVAPINDGMVRSLDPAHGQIELLGSRCATCGEVSLGTNAVCLNCGGDNIESIALGSEGTLWTFTVVRHRPPGNYLGPDPFEPFGVGLVELPSGLRVMTPLDGDISTFRIGDKVRLAPWLLREGEDRRWLAFRFTAAGGSAA
ncbi:MAG: OB-fold domain-containing protein [Gammaproteobacteria bacterium]|nr:OB-fold domain-containing protein [Gammaproteobacteria bacterium]